MCEHGYRHCYVCHDHKIMAVDEDGLFFFVDIDKFNSLLTEGKAKYIETEETLG